MTAVSSGGSTAGALWSFTTGTGSGGTAPEVVIYASDVAAGGIHGSWSRIADATAAGGMKLSTPDAGSPAQDPPLAAPANYFETTFQADGSTRYRVWLRLRAIANSKFNDSVTVQFSDSTNSGGSPIYRIGTTSGLMVNLATDAGAASVQNWGWQRNAYWLADTGDVWFQNSGAHTIRVQVREDGVEVDQIVISPVTYATNAPGPVSNDTTIVTKPGSTCQDTLNLTYTSGTLNIGFTLGTSSATTWSAWLVAQNNVYPIWSVAIPAVSPAASFNVPVPNFPRIGTISIVTTLGPPATPTCGDIKNVDTGH